MPLYLGAEPSLSQLYADLTASPSEFSDAAEEVKQVEASHYVVNELLLTEKDFVRLYQVSNSPEASAEEWTEVYVMLELAQRKVRSIQLPSPYVEELQNVYAEADVADSVFSLSGEEEESLRFETFGGRQKGMPFTSEPARLGLGISSPLLLLNEGRRHIEIAIALEDLSIKEVDLEYLLESDSVAFPPFLVQLTTIKGWIEPENTKFFFGDFTVNNAETAFEGTMDENIVKMSKGNALVPDDIGKYLVWTDGSINKIIKVLADDTAEVLPVGSTDQPSQILKYHSSDVYLKALKIEVDLDENDAAIEPLAAENEEKVIDQQYPAFMLMLNHEKKDFGYVSHYQELKDLKMKKVHLQVEVDGLRQLYLQNDQSQLDSKKPFEPFGFEPEAGGRFYISHEELSLKRLTDIKFDFQWMKVPENLAAYYDSYSKIEGQEKPSINSNSDFKAQLFLCQSNTEMDLSAVELFTNNGHAEVSNIPAHLQQEYKAFQYLTFSSIDKEDEVIDWGRYFRLELNDPDFQHDIYANLFVKQSQLSDEAIRNLIINPPYTPKLKSLKIGYSASSAISPDASGELGQLYHVHPFGYSEVNPGEHILPQYNQEGALYLGVSKLIAPQTLSLLFQMAEGSANPEVEKPVLSWSYLHNNEWLPIAASEIPLDTTNNLLNTGIIQLNVPEGATNTDTLIPGQLHWLRVLCNGDTTGISDTISIRAQAISATFSSEKVAVSHFKNPLLSGAISEPLVPTPEINTIAQPYTSDRGKPAEESTIFYNRISERLRHKNRAVNMWDYERLVLEEFPEVYKVKCLPMHAEAEGAVSVMVIPDIKGKLPFNPFQPKVPADTLEKIRLFLDTCSPAYATVLVKNPTYLQIKTRCLVKFKEGYNEGFYKEKLIGELKKFLAPWAYDEGSDITIGGTVYASVLINFIAERPYIEYVANMKLFQSEDGKQFVDVRTLHGGQNKVVAHKPDMILVSATNHEIDVVDESGYDDEKFEGINYWKVELDFIVGEDLA
ncbi:baseplate J/gp47 family protein [Fulvivirga maritima]|uniref:baseplate J/gp47 family protein n=1 Tax=Fulvivirga maritima TaxID=2904247 RepID=UPI001F38454C|nr:baseplate J/gp47 family protein [Fulvivirga maritima]UII24681.1 baseplate J/gp47 family protein [Fulvivirga maritima]